MFFDVIVEPADVLERRDMDNGSHVLILGPLRLTLTTDLMHAIGETCRDKSASSACDNTPGDNFPVVVFDGPTGEPQ